jgi:hypothetical protein
MNCSKLGRYHWARVEWTVQSEATGSVEASEEPGGGARRSLRRYLKAWSSSMLWGSQSPGLCCCQYRIAQEFVNCWLTA